MQDRLALIIKNAFRKGRLRGTFVHMTHDYFEPEHYRAYGAAAVLMQGLRRHNVPIVHIVHILENTIDGKTELTPEDVKKLHVTSRPVEELTPQEGDRIFPWSEFDGFENQAATAYFNTIAKSVSVGAGLYSNICFRKTMNGYLQRTEKSRAIIATDCTEEPMSLANFDEDVQGRVLEATAAEILGILAMTEPP